MKNFEDVLIEKNDEIDNAAYNLAVALVRANNPGEAEAILPWDMSIIGEIVDAAEEILQKKGYKTCHPYYCDEGEISCPESGTCSNPNCPLTNKGV